MIPFSSTYKYCGAAFSGDAYVLGAPEFVLREDYEKFKVLIEITVLTVIVCLYLADTAAFQMGRN